jgi:ParB-like chromosome segregation protein Spo0J
MSEQRLPIHPYAELFPPLTSPEFGRLCDDIEQNGLLEEIVIHAGQVLDGRNRYLACLARGVTPRFRPYTGECGSPLAFVVARNLHRRHLSESQRARWLRRD